MYDVDGVYLDPEKVEAVQSMPAPISVTELQEFLGLVAYFSPFIFGLSTLVSRHLQGSCNASAPNTLWSDSMEYLHHIYVCDTHQILSCTRAAPSLYLEVSMWVLMSFDMLKE